LLDSGTFNAAKSGMKALPKILLALTAVAALSLVPPAKANLIVNGGFETGNFSGWTVTPAPSGSNIGVGHGEGAPDSTLGALFGGLGPGSDAISQTFATTPGAFYTLSFFYRVNDTTFTANNAFNVLWNGVSIPGGLFPQSNVNPGFLTATIHLQATSAFTTLEFEGYNNPSFDFIDNVSVTRGTGVPDTGSTVSLLGCALLGLAVLRRKLG
jgi:hypothetical protein